jgi:hypothetical protein
MQTTLTINDLSPSEELDREAMAAICGGFGALSSFVPRNLINQELNALTIVGNGSTFLGGDTDLRVTNTYSQSANQIDGGADLNALTHALGLLGRLGRN